MLNGLDLFSGIGGLTLALSEWVTPIAYCENERYAQAVLLSRMADGGLPRASIWDDVTSLSGAMLPTIDIIYGGFPCQDISVAGRGVGLGGERSGLFWQIERLVRETNPRFVFLENVPAIRTRGLNAIIQSFTELGYDCRWTVVSAAEVGAPHLRKRWFMLAHSKCEQLWHESGWSGRTHGQSEIVARFDGAKESLADANQSRPFPGSLERIHRGENKTRSRHGEPQRRCRGKSPPLANTKSDRREQRRPESKGIEGRSSTTGGGSSVADALREGRDGERSERSSEENSTRSCGELTRSGWWAVEPDVGRVAHGIPNRVDRLRGLGNACVPLQGKIAFMRLMGLQEQVQK